MKKLFLFVIAGFTVFCLTASALAQTNQVLDQVIAVVDDDYILLSELRQQSFSMAHQYKINPQRDIEQFNMLMQQVLDNMIVQKILYLKAIEDSVIVEETQVEQMLDQRVASLLQQHGSREKVREVFGMSVEKIKRNFADEARESLLANNVRQTKEMQIKVNRREVEEFYAAMKDSLPDVPESYQISNLLIKIKPGVEAEEKALQRIQLIQEQLKDGAEFQQLAKDFSDDKSSAVMGGELGFFARGELVKEFEEVAYQLKPDEISAIVKSNFGYHIIQLIEQQGDKINCRHILVTPEPNRDDEVCVVDTIKSVHQKIVSGEKSFEEMVAEYSEDLSSKDSKGDLGWWEEDNIQPKEFKWVISDLKPGEVSEPVKTEMGYHILKLVDKHEPRAIDLQKDWQRIEDWALRMKRQQELQKWIEKLKEKVYISIKEVSAS